MRCATLLRVVETVPKVQKGSLIVEKDILLGTKFTNLIIR
jgi:hypothetical protein